MATTFTSHGAVHSQAGLQTIHGSSYHGPVYTGPVHYRFVILTQISVPSVTIRAAILRRARRTDV